MKSVLAAFLLVGAALAKPAAVSKDSVFGGIFCDACKEVVTLVEANGGSDVYDQVNNAAQYYCESLGFFAQTCQTQILAVADDLVAAINEQQSPSDACANVNLCDRQFVYSTTRRPGYPTETSPNPWNWPTDTSRNPWNWPTETTRGPWNWPTETSPNPWNRPTETTRGPWNWPTETSRNPWNWPTDTTRGNWNWPTETTRNPWNFPQSTTANSWNFPTETTRGPWNAPSETPSYPGSETPRNPWNVGTTTSPFP